MNPLFNPNPNPNQSRPQTNIPVPAEEPEFVLGKLDVTDNMKAWGLKIIGLLRATFGDSAKCKENWRVAEVPVPAKMKTLLIVPGATPEANNGVNIALLLHPKPEERFIRATLIGDMATTILLGVVDARRGTSQSVNRETFSNDQWESFIGWAAITKEEYDRYHKPVACKYTVRKRILFWDPKVEAVTQLDKGDEITISTDFSALLHPVTGAHVATVRSDEVIQAIQNKNIEPIGSTGPKQTSSKGIPFRYVGNATELVLESSSPGVPVQTVKQGEVFHLIEVPDRPVPYMAVPWPPHDPVGEIAVPLKITWAKVEFMAQKDQGTLVAEPVAPATPAPKAPDSAKAEGPGKDARKYRLLPGCMFSVALPYGFYGFTVKDMILLTDEYVTIVQSDGKVQPSSTDPHLRAIIEGAIKEGILSQVGGPLQWRLYRVTSRNTLEIDTPESQEMQGGKMVTVQEEPITLEPSTNVALTPEFGLLAALQPGRLDWDNYPLNDRGERLVRRWVKEGLLELVPDKTDLRDEDLNTLLVPKNSLDKHIEMPDRATWTRMPDDSEEGSSADSGE